VKRADPRASKRTPKVNWANRKEAAKAAEKKKSKEVPGWLQFFTEKSRYQPLN
jgi:hypothetical protein